MLSLVRQWTTRTRQCSIHESNVGGRLAQMSYVYLVSSGKCFARAGSTRDFNIDLKALNASNNMTVPSIQWHIIGHSISSYFR